MVQERRAYINKQGRGETECPVTCACGLDSGAVEWSSETVFFKAWLGWDQGAPSCIESGREIAKMTKSKIWKISACPMQIISN